MDEQAALRIRYNFRECQLHLYGTHLTMYRVLTTPGAQEALELTDEEFGRVLGDTREVVEAGQTEYHHEWMQRQDARRKGQDGSSEPPEN